MIPLGIFAATRSANLSPPISPVQTFAYTGAEQTFVNTKYTRLTAKMWGGAANGGWYGTGRWGGGGGYTEVVYPIVPGDVVTVMVGGGGAGGPRGTNILGGWPDGGNGTIGDATGGGGGGSSRIFVNQTLVAVAGGAGAGCGYSGWGGSGGGAEGDAGSNYGRPGTQTSAGYVGGAVGIFEDGGNRKNGGGPITYATRFKRTGGHGGDSDQPSGDDAGAGGGGYYGGSGGGGDANSGGGGSGYASENAISAVLTKGTAGGGDPPGFNDPVWPGGTIARGTASNTDLPGGNGYIWIGLS